MSKMVALLALLAGLSSLASAGPKPEALNQFQQYLAEVEKRMAREQRSASGFVPALWDPTRKGKLQIGEVLIEHAEASKLDGGLIHHWVGIAFIPGASLNQVLAVTGDIASFPRYYGPEVVTARVVSRSPQEALVSMRLRKQHIVTAVFDVDYQVRLGILDADHRFSSSRSVQIHEVRDPGEPNESWIPPDEDHGFLWHMNAYWRYVQTDEGVYVRCESVSLSRDIPFGMGWLIGSVVHRMPRESLRSTLEATRSAVKNASLVSDNMEITR